MERVYSQVSKIFTEASAAKIPDRAGPAVAILGMRDLQQMGMTTGTETGSPSWGHGKAPLAHEGDQIDATRSVYSDAGMVLTIHGTPNLSTREPKPGDQKVSLNGIT